MKTKRIFGETEISGANLAFLIDANPEKYASKEEIQNNVQSSSYDSSNYMGRISSQEDKVFLCAIAEALSLETLKGMPIGTRKVSKGQYLSGEVWRDNHYNDILLYVGKVADKDVVLRVGGINPDSFSFSTGYINGENDKIFFDEKIFPRR